MGSSFIPLLIPSRRPAKWRPTRDNASRSGVPPSGLSPYNRLYQLVRCVPSNVLIRVYLLELTGEPGLIVIKPIR